jgi:NADH:ubiquinone oxidoreductase subunit F (NADH-binding)
MRNPPSDKQYVICTVDESTLMTFEDRFIMHAVPHCLIEQMIGAGLMVGALGIIYSWRDDRANNQISPSHASVTLMTAPVKARFARCSEPFYA